MKTKFLTLETSFLDKKVSEAFFASKMMIHIEGTLTIAYITSEMMVHINGTTMAHATSKMMCLPLL